jgi:hypothetical protein
MAKRTWLDDMLDAYIETALWSSTDDEGNALYRTFDASNIATETKAKMLAEISGFVSEADEAGVDIGGLPQSFEQVAHDFWLTRNRHGAGFWDGDYEAPADKILTRIAHRFGEVDLYVGDDGMIYQSGGSSGMNGIGRGGRRCRKNGRFVKCGR